MAIYNDINRASTTIRISISYLTNETLENAITFATKASAITVSREGASKSIPYANEIQ